MKCPYCEHRNTSVNNSRKIGLPNIIWRRRECLRCQKIFTTRESCAEDNLFVIKRNGKRQRFLYYKFFASIFNVINFGKFHDSGDSAKLSKKIADQVVKKLYSKIDSKKNVRTQDIIKITHSFLLTYKKSYADYFANYSEYRQKVLK